MESETLFPGLEHGAGPWDALVLLTLTLVCEVAPRIPTGGHRNPGEAPVSGCKNEDESAHRPRRKALRAAFPAQQPPEKPLPTRGTGRPGGACRDSRAGARLPEGRPARAPEDAALGPAPPPPLPPRPASSPATGPGRPRLTLRRAHCAAAPGTRTGPPLPRPRAPLGAAGAGPAPGSRHGNATLPARGAQSRKPRRPMGARGRARSSRGRGPPRVEGCRRPCASLFVAGASSTRMGREGRAVRGSPLGRAAVCAGLLRHGRGPPDKAESSRTEGQAYLKGEGPGARGQWK
ncbi:translation initiation factor IF-2-like [Lutra lutra]|uniref:translation initiation factor IF-2-like n=1 Tax=Lutra lutra TaxID=9657 RepID=UPI001FD2D0B4|nr:translation initiation factor IF-2-like [Lutra lutra]